MTENKLYHKMAECIEEMRMAFNCMSIAATGYHDDYVADFANWTLKLQGLILNSQPLEKIEEFYSVGKLYTRNSLRDILNDYISDLLEDMEEPCQLIRIGTLYLPMEQLSPSTMEKIFKAMDSYLFTKDKVLLPYDGFIDQKGKYIIAFN
jgi:hypothetical protein